MFRFQFVLILLMFCFVSTKLLAIEVNDLYQVTVAVESQTAEHRKQAIPKALQGVFLKVGGINSVLEHKLLLQAQKSPASYVNQYRYHRKADELNIVVSFNESKVNALFKRANLPLWGSLRPQVLLWLIDEQGATRSIVPYDAKSAIPERVNEFSAQRGLPIVMPLMDLTDNEHVFVSDFWGYFPEQIQQASSRYFADIVVVMRVSDSSLVSDEIKKRIDNADDAFCDPVCPQGEVKIAKVLDWKVFTQGALYIQQYQGTDKTNLITQGLSDITELIYKSYALSTTAEGDFVIEVKNVTSLKSDIQLFDFLMDLSAVKTTTLISAQGDVRRFKLELNGSQSSLLASLKLNNKLTQLIEPQLNDSFESSEYNPMLNSPDDSKAIETYRGLRVINLGNKPEKNSDNDSTIALDVEQKHDDIDEKAPTQDTAEQQPEQATDNTPEVNENITPVPEDNLVLTLEPNIPIFYWEQG